MLSSSMTTTMNTQRLRNSKFLIVIINLTINCVDIPVLHRMYRDKLATLKDQLMQLEAGLHPEYVRRLRRLEQMFEERKLLEEVFLEFEVKLNEIIIL